MLLPIVANLLGLPLRTGIFCLFGCEANLRDDQPLSGAIAYGQLVFTVVLVAYALLIPAFVFWLGGKIGWYIVPVLAVIGGHAVVHWLAILSPTSGARCRTPASRSAWCFGHSGCNDRVAPHAPRSSPHLTMARRFQTQRDRYVHTARAVGTFASP